MQEKRVIVLLGLACFCAMSVEAAAATTSNPQTGISAPLFSLIVFLVCTAIGIIAIIAGTGGGVLFTTLFMGFTSIHPDIVRATGLLAAVCGTRIGARRYLRKGIANIRLVLFLGTSTLALLLSGPCSGSQSPGSSETLVSQ